MPRPRRRLIVGVLHAYPVSSNGINSYLCSQKNSYDHKQEHDCRPSHCRTPLPRRHGGKEEGEKGGGAAIGEPSQRGVERIPTARRRGRDSGAGNRK